METRAYNETSCFQTGLCADKRPPRRPLEMPPADGERRALEAAETREEDGEISLLPLLLLRFASWAAALEPIAPRAEIALEEVWRERLTGVPLTSLSVSAMGSRETNSFCSNWTTTYGLACILRTLRPRDWMSLTWSWPLEVATWGGVVDGVAEEAEEVEVEVDVDVDGADFLPRGGCCILKSGACMERCVVGWAEVKGPKGEAKGVRSEAADPP
jgi:hypothetical protein